MLYRHKENPLIKPEAVTPSRKEYRVKGVFNPGAVYFKGELILLLRVSEGCEERKGFASVPYYQFEGGKGHIETLNVKLDDPDLQLKDTRGVVYRGKDYLSTISHIRLARSKDGVHFRIDNAPFIYPSNESESFGIEDARAVAIGDAIYITYTVISPDGYATALATTKDFLHVERKGIILPPLNKDACIFPEKVNGKFCALHRPLNIEFGKPSIWYAESPDLIHWGNHCCIIRPRQTHYEQKKVGAGPSPIKTPDGWLEIYHGKGENDIYSLFLLLLDLERPWKVLKRGEQPILEPVEAYEKEGFVPNVTFCNGLIEKEGGKLLLYYGSCDETVCMAETTVEELLKTLK